MKLGLLLAEYNSIDFIARCLEPWIEFNKVSNSIEIVVVDAKFKETDDGSNSLNSNDGTLDILKDYQEKGLIKLIVAKPGLTEAEARNLGVEYLLTKNVDFIKLIGVDEIWTIQEINNVTEYIQKHPLITWFRIEYKNLTFSSNTFVKGFRPGRIFRVQSADYRVKEMYYDDDFLYISNSKQIVNYKTLPCKQIPVNVSNPLHYTWLNDIRSKAKVKYQEIRFNPPIGFGCSFKWNDEKNCLEWNEEYFKRSGESIPELFNLD